MEYRRRRRIITFDRPRGNGLPEPATGPRSCHNVELNSRRDRIDRCLLQLPDESVGMTYGIPSNKNIDPVKLDAWIQMNTVREGNPRPGAAFIHLDDLMMGFEGSRLESNGATHSDS